MGEPRQRHVDGAACGNPADAQRRAGGADGQRREARCARRDRDQRAIGESIVEVDLVVGGSGTAIIGSAPRSKAGMAAAMESVSYEFDTLITVAITGSLLPMFYALFTPVDASISLTDALHTPALNDGARAGLDSSYLAIFDYPGCRCCHCSDCDCGDIPRQPEGD